MSDRRFKGERASKRSGLKPPSFPMAIILYMLPPELFIVVSEHLPRSHRHCDLLSLALSCHRVQEIIIPHILYRSVRFVNERHTYPFLQRFVEENGRWTRCEKDNDYSPVPRSHFIHYLCLDMTKHERNILYALNYLCTLFEANGLENLRGLPCTRPNLS